MEAPRGLCTFRLCLSTMATSTDGTFLMLLRCGLILTTPWFQSESLFSTETLRITSLKLSNLRSHPATLCLVWNPLWIRCSRDVSSRIPIPIDIDSELTTIRSPSTARTEPRSPTDNVMAPWLPTETKVPSLTTNLTRSTLTSPNLNRSLASKESPVWLVMRSSFI